MNPHTQSIIIALLSLCMAISSCSNSQIDQLHETIYVRHEGADLPMYVRGNGTDKVFLLVLHGAGSFGLAFRTEAFIQEIESRYAVVYHDQRGQSMAQGRYQTPEDLVNLMANDVIALVQVLKEKYGEDIQLFLMGHSWGGALSSAVLTKGDNQQLFQGWINVSGAHDIPKTAEARRGFLLTIAEEQINAGNSPDGWQQLADEVAKLDSTSEEDYPLILRQAATAMDLLLEDGVALPHVNAALMRRTLFENNPLSWKVSDFFNRPYAVAQDQGLSFTQNLAELTIPALIVFGKYDVSVPPSVGRLAFEALGSMDKELVILERSIHHPQDSESERFAGLVVDFIEAHR